MSVTIPLVAADGTKSTVTLAPPVVNTVTGGFFDDFIGAAGTAPNPALWSVATQTIPGGVEKYSTANVYLDGSSHAVIALTAPNTGGCFHGYTGNFVNPVKTKFGYGLIEANIKVPKAVAGSGFWTAWWVFGNNFPTVSWPNCGEIDIWEQLGGPGSSTSYYATVHGPTGDTADAYNMLQAFVTAAQAGVTDFGTGYHTYWTNWTGTGVSVGVDNYTAATWTTASLNTQFGLKTSTWPTMPNPVPIFAFDTYAVPAAALLPAYMLIDWVRFTPA